MYRVFFMLAGLWAALFSFVNQASALDVYLFRGAGDFSFVQKNLHFSRGIDKMARQLQAEGFHARATRWENTSGIYREIVRRKPQSVAFIGHSMGAIAAMGMARRMKSLGIPVAYVGLIDIPGPIGSVSNNVALAENFYHAFPVYGMLRKPAGHPGIISNHYVFGQIHISMDDSSRIQNAMISALWQADMNERKQGIAYAQTAVKPNGEKLDTTVTSSIGQFGSRVKNGAGKLVDLLRF